MGLALNHHISTSSSHGLMSKPLSLLFPSSLLSFLHYVKLFTLLPHPAQCSKTSHYRIFLVYH